MATNVIMPALEMAQESGVLVNWLKRDGETVNKGEPLMEIETDKVTVEIEAPASGILGGILAHEGDVVPVGHTIAWILAPGEKAPAAPPIDLPSARAMSSPVKNNGAKPATTVETKKIVSFEASPLARKVAEEHRVDLSLVKPSGKRIEKADVMAYLDERSKSTPPASSQTVGVAAPTKVLASPKARRLASERGLDLKTVSGSGPDGAVLADDVLNAKIAEPVSVESLSVVWRVMAERMSQSWTTVPHFYLMREVDASQLMEWRKHIIESVEKRVGLKPTYTDLLVKLTGHSLREHPRVNAAWANGNIQFNNNVNVGIAAAVDDGLIVPVIRNADGLSVGEIAVQRKDLIERAQNRKLRPADIADGTFTLSNLGMYNVDAFNAIVNTPQAAILAVGRIVERVVPINGEVVIKPMMILSLSCDHRVVDGARAAQFLDELANLIEDPWRLLS